MSPRAFNKNFQMFFWALFLNLVPGYAHVHSKLDYVCVTDLCSTEMSRSAHWKIGPRPAENNNLDWISQALIFGGAKAQGADQTCWLTSSLVYVTNIL